MNTATEKAAAQVPAQGQAPEPRGIPHSPPASAAPYSSAPVSPEPREPLPSPAGAGGAGTPTAEAIVNAVAQSFGVIEETAYGWIVDTFSNQRRAA